MLRLNNDLSAQDIAFADNVSDEEVTVALEEICSFATCTLHHLIRAETKALGYRPSISLFCRLDIGVMLNEHGELRYFVNEVTRGPTNATLWAGRLPDTSGIPHNLSSAFARPFHTYLTRQLS